MTATHTSDAPAPAPEAGDEVTVLHTPTQRGHTPAGGPRAQRRPAIDAPRAFPRADRPAPVPAPEHHHLPGWVRRDFGRVRPALADLLALLQGDARAELQKRIDELTAGISSGKFSLAWQYPDIVEQGRRLYEQQRADQAEVARAARALDTARRRATTHLRDSAGLLTSEASSRLQRALRSAPDLAAVAAVEADLERSAGSARSAHSKRRDKEIERTRARILRSTPRAAMAEEPQTETWQDVLRRFAEGQAVGSEDGAAS